jgi:hypothetical protein
MARPNVVPQARGAGCIATRYLGPAQAAHSCAYHAHEGVNAEVLPPL